MSNLLCSRFPNCNIKCYDKTNVATDGCHALGVDSFLSVSVAKRSIQVLIEARTLTHDRLYYDGRRQLVEHFNYNTKTK